MDGERGGEVRPGGEFALWPIRVRAVRIRTRSGERERPLVEHPGAAAVVPVEAGEVYLVRQWRYAVGENLLEIPAGTREEGETLEECASRELREEAGLRAGRLIKLFEGYPIPGYGSERLAIFLGLDLEHVERDLEEDEFIEVVSLPLREAVRMVRSGRIRDLKTALGILLAWQAIQSGEVSAGSGPSSGVP
ncbi:MAG: ADP-ribose pyrophosphatase [Thermoproteota archaeon]|nr:MAG: ADP-ribose pyrophosphatase [Candidatus Korarchaeota archaeon]